MTFDRGKAVSKYLSELGRLLDGVALAREEVLGEGVEDVDAEAEVAAADGDVHADDLVLVRLVDLQRRLKHVQEVGQGAVPEGSKRDLRSGAHDTGLG